MCYEFNMLNMISCFFHRPQHYSPCQEETFTKCKDNILNFMGFLYLHKNVNLPVSACMCGVLHFECALIYVSSCRK